MAGDELGDRALGRLVVGEARTVGGEARILGHVGHADGGVKPLGHRLHGAGDRDPAVVAGAVDVARAGDVGAAALALRDDAGGLEHGRVRTDHRVDGLEQGEIDHLAFAALQLDLAQRDHDGIGAVEAGDHVGQGRGRQHRLAIGKAGLGGVARHALDQRAEARLLRVGARLAPAGDAHDHQLAVAGVQGFGPELHALQRPRAIVLDQHVGVLDEAQQQLLAARLAQVQRQALLVAGVGLPEQRVALYPPVTQGIALGGVLDLDHLAAEVGELQREHVARHQPRQIEHDDAVERAGGIGPEWDHGGPWRGDGGRPEGRRVFLTEPAGGGLLQLRYASSAKEDGAVAMWQQPLMWRNTPCERSLSKNRCKDRETGLTPAVYDLDRTSDRAAATLSQD